MGQKKKYRKKNRNKKIQNEFNPIKLDRPKINERIALISIPEYPAIDLRSNILILPSGVKGTYLVTFILSIPGKETFRSELNIQRLLDSGESLLVVPKISYIKIDIYNDKRALAEARLHPNSKGELATIQTKVEAQNFIEAEIQAYDICLPILSYLSYLFDVALDIAGYEVKEEYTEASKWVFSILGEQKAFDHNLLDTGFISNPEFRIIFAAYREALNSANVFYQFLSFYRVIEGIKNIRSQRKQKIIASGKPYREPAEKIPEKEDELPFKDELVINEFRSYLGKKFTWIVNEHYRELLRNAIAHIDPTQNVLIMDKFEDISKCEKAIYIIKYIAREMIQNELSAKEEA